MRTHLRGHLARLASHLEGQLRRYGGQPGFWADDVRRVLDALHETLTGGDFVVPEDLAGAFGREQGRALLPRLVRRFGEALQAWPDVVEAARQLRARGERPGRQVG